MPAISVFYQRVLLHWRCAKRALIAGGVIVVLNYPALTFATADGQIPMPAAGDVIILQKNTDRIKWAVIKVTPDPADNDPYYHAEIFSRQIKSEPWRYQRLEQHMVLTPDAVKRSLTGKKGKIYSYKDVEFYGAYNLWRQDSATRAKTPVCKTSIMDCLTIR